MPKVKVVDDTVKSVVGLWKAPFKNTKTFSTVAPLVTVKPVVEPSPVYPRTSPLNGDVESPPLLVPPAISLIVPESFI